MCVCVYIYALKLRTVAPMCNRFECNRTITMTIESLNADFELFDINRTEMYQLVKKFVAAYMAWNQWDK